MTAPSEAVIRHLEVIQGVINRMSSNAFALKALAGTITAAVVAYTGAVEAPTYKILLAGIVPVAVFWFMDAQYLRQEKLFRELYNGVRKGEIVEAFDMDYTRYSEKVSGVVCIAFSRAVVWFYVSLIALLAVLAIVTVST